MTSEKRNSGKKCRVRSTVGPNYPQLPGKKESGCCCWIYLDMFSLELLQKYYFTIYTVCIWHYYKPPRSLKQSGIDDIINEVRSVNSHNTTTLTLSNSYNPKTVTRVLLILHFCVKLCHTIWSRGSQSSTKKKTKTKKHHCDYNALTLPHYNVINESEIHRGIEHEFTISYTC